MGAFATTSGVRSRQTGVPLGAQASEEDAGGYSYSRYATGHAYNAGIEEASRQKTMASRTRGGVQRRRVGIAGVSMPAYKDDVTRRTVAPSDYTDDLRYDNVTDPYERASTISGRRGSRNIAQVDRPNVRRRQPSSAAAQQRRAPQRPGVMGALQNYFSDTGRTIATVFALVVVIITAVLLFSVRSCMTARTTPTTTKTVSVNNSTTDSSKNSTTTNSNTDTSKKDSTNTSKSTTTTEPKKEETPKQTTVVVTVADGQTSWVEITVDGKSVEADAITGPWSQTYTVTDSMTVLAGTPGAVAVTVNGTAKPFDANASGIGTLTIQGTKPADGTAANASGTQTNSTSTSTTNGTTGATNNQNSNSNSNN